MDPTPNPEATETMADAIERLRGTKVQPTTTTRRTPPPRLPYQRAWIAAAVAVVLVGVAGAFEVAHRAESESDYAAVESASATRDEPTTTTSSTVTTTPAPPAAVPAPAEATPTTTPPATAPPTTMPPPTTTTTRAPTPTTTTAPVPKPVRTTSSTATASGVQLTLVATPPTSRAPRTADFSLDAEFGDVRVLRSVRFDFGDGGGGDGSVVQWPCLDPAAPNPYHLAGPTHVYAGPGTYTVTATVRTAPCSVPDGAELAQETAEVQLTLVVS